MSVRVNYQIVPMHDSKNVGRLMQGFSNWGPGPLGVLQKDARGLQKFYGKKDSAKNDKSPQCFIILSMDSFQKCLYLNHSSEFFSL